jgi:LacI family transcriptional regulator
MTNVSLKDLARQLGLSVTAVSKALNDAEDISEPTKEAVKKLAAEMGYVPNRLALSLKRGTTKTIAVVINDFRNPYFAALCDIAIKKINAKGYQANFFFTNKHLVALDDIYEILNNKCISILSFVEPTDEVADFTMKRNLPFFLVGINSPSPQINSIYTDDYEGGKQVGEYFVKSNYKKGLFLTNSFSETSYRRYSGFSDVLVHHQKNVNIIPFSGVSDDEIIKSSLATIKLNKYDFVFCFSDYLAIILKRALKTINYHEKIMIFGYDNLNKYYQIIEKINSVSADYEEIIEFTVDEIIAYANKSKNEQININKVFPTSIVFEN